MTNINNAIIISLITLVFVVFVLNFPEQFTNIINSDNTNNKDINGFITEDISELELEEVIPDKFQSDVENLVDQILERFNRDYNKKLIRTNIERVEKNIDENITNYKVWVFVFNYKKESNGKVELVFSVDENDHVKVDKVHVLGSRQSILSSRGGVSTRDSSSFKEPVNMDNVDGLVMGELDVSPFNVVETQKKMVDRNSWILHKARKDIGNVKVFPSRKTHSEWDIFGVKLLDKMEKDSPGGINHGNRNNTLVPHFMKHNFEACFGDNLWLFDKAQDVVSRPIGVG